MKDVRKMAGGKGGEGRKGLRLAWSCPSCAPSHTSRRRGPGGRRPPEPADSLLQPQAAQTTSFRCAMSKGALIQQIDTFRDKLPLTTNVALDPTFHRRYFHVKIEKLLKNVSPVHRSTMSQIFLSPEEMDLVQKGLFGGGLAFTRVGHNEVSSLVVEGAVRGTRGVSSAGQALVPKVHGVAVLQQRLRQLQWQSYKRERQCLHEQQSRFGSSRVDCFVTAL